MSAALRARQIHPSRVHADCTGRKPVHPKPCTGGAGGQGSGPRGRSREPRGTMIEKRNCALTLPLTCLEQWNTVQHDFNLRYLC